MFRNIIVLFFCFVISFTGCKKNSTEPSTKAEPLEINGTWTLTDQFGSLTITISNTEFKWSRGAVSGTSNITYFDNSKNILVVKHIYHPDPAQQNKYMKMTWTPDNPTNNAYFCTYLYNDNQDSALAETTVDPSDYPREAQKGG